MLLRSSSTPVIGTLLSPFSGSPNREFDEPVPNNNNNYTKNSPFIHHLNLTSFSCNPASPMSHSASGFVEINQESKSSGPKSIRKARSDGNLEGLGVYSSCDMEGFRNSDAPINSSHKHESSMLETAPSFSIFNSDQEPLERTITIGDSIELIRLGGGDFCFGKKGMGLIEEKSEEEEEGLDMIQTFRGKDEVMPPSPPMYLATGYGDHAAGFGGHTWVDDISLEEIEESGNAEEYYQRKLEEYPCHPLLLRNYAKVLQSKGDFQGAEEYYFRTTQANPEDGEALLQYAQLVWQLHRDQDRALSYFERAAQATPEDSDVLAAYASFLWEIEDEVEEDEACRDQTQIAAGSGIDIPDSTAAGSRRADNAEENYKMMIEEDPNNALFLRNYAQFLCQSKGDLQGAEEYYLRAIRADPGDGEIMAQYAKLVWELHHDNGKALSYFERAIQATPEDSYVLAAYANFLWEAEDEEDSIMENHNQVPLVQGGAVSPASA